MSRVFVAGLGAVSPAGWGVAALREALARGEPLAGRQLESEGGGAPVQVREVPPPATRPAFLAHPRLRRATAVAQFAAGAALEAMTDLTRRIPPPQGVGLIACLQSGCVQYSCRFFAEVRQDPATASPLLFPETVFSAPASHVAVVVPGVTRATTLVGDPGVFLQGLALGCDWLRERTVDVALVISADETNWMHSHAAAQLDRKAILAIGGGAVALVTEPARSLGVELERLTAPVCYDSRTSRARAALALRDQLPDAGADELLVDGCTGRPRADGVEATAWRDWPGARLSPKRVLGDGLGAGAAWQCVAACDALAQGRHAAATVSVVGCNQQAIAARFVRSPERAPGPAPG